MTYPTLNYRTARPRIESGDLLLFGGRTLWPSLPIRFWDNGYRWYQWRGWCTLGDWSHAEIAHWDHEDNDPVLEGWGSVGGGPRKAALSGLLATYGSFGWAPFLGNEQERRLVLAMARRLWRPGARYPNFRQYIRTACRRLYAEKVDCDPLGYTCWEWVAACHSIRYPAAQYASDLIRSGLFGPLARVTLP